MLQCILARVFIVLICGARRKKKIVMWLWISNYGILHKEENAETDAEGGQVHTATKIITMETRIWVCSCVSTCVRGARVWCCTKAGPPTIRLLQKRLSPCTDEHASIWRAKSAMSVSGQLVLCDDGRTLVWRKTGEVLVIWRQNCLSALQMHTWMNPLIFAIGLALGGWFYKVMRLRQTRPKIQSGNPLSREMMASPRHLLTGFHFNPAQPRRASQDKECQRPLQISASPHYAILSFDNSSSAPFN